MGIFKAYDIRGIYGEELTPDLAYRVGRSLPTLLHGKKALIGHDARTTSGVLDEALTRGLTEAGCDVDDMGFASTPMVYFFTASKKYDFSVQITASHNPSNYNGFKISRAGARPVGYATGLADLERMVASDLPAKASVPGKASKVAYHDEFVSFLKPWIPDLSGLKLVVDCSDGMGALVAHDLFGKDAVYLADVPDGRFPHHPPNPLEEAGRVPVTRAVLDHHADVGVIFDGDADRVMFIDEKGRFVRPDLMIAIMADAFLRRHPGSPILQDIRTSRGVTEHLVAAGAEPAMWKVGHAFAKVKLRELNAVFGGELAGHYYFRDFFWCDSGELASLVALGEIVAARKRGLSFSELVAPIDCYANTGELNYRVGRKNEAIESVRAHLLSEMEPEKVLDFDGYRIEYPDWWVSIRPSNTEPYLRLIIEAGNEDLLQQKRTEIERYLAPFLAK